MRSNYFDSMILGTITNGQGYANAVEGTHRAALRALAAKVARRLSLCLGSWRALSLKRTAAGTTPVVAMCPIHSGSRRQRQERCRPSVLLGARVVVVDTGTVGVN